MIRALAFHTEKLHDDLVWERLQGILRVTRLRGIKVTFFIYPFRAILAGKDISQRIRILVEEGHEIGQHTHFYAGTAVDKPNKYNDLSSKNIRACITRDYEWLRSHGVKPLGFTAGSWIFSESSLETMAELEFQYDCSARIPVLRRRQHPNTELNLWLPRPETRQIKNRSLLLLPTTHVWSDLITLRPLGEVQYQLIYLHDYDLLRTRVRIGMNTFLRLGHFVSAYDIVHMYKKALIG